MRYRNSYIQEWSRQQGASNRLSDVASNRVQAVKNDWSATSHFRDAYNIEYVQPEHLHLDQIEICKYMRLTYAWYFHLNQACPNAAPLSKP